MKCHKCKSSLTKKDVYCPSCGKKIKKPKPQESNVLKNNYHLITILILIFFGVAIISLLMYYGEKTEKLETVAQSNESLQNQKLEQEIQNLTNQLQDSNTELQRTRKHAQLLDEEIRRLSKGILIADANYTELKRKSTIKEKEEADLKQNVRRLEVIMEACKKHLNRCENR